MSQAQLITGQCHCGAVKYQSTGPKFRQGVCTCPACQSATGTLASPNIGVKPETFTIVQGIPASFKHPTSNDHCYMGTFHFCTDCGAPLYWTDPAGNEVAIMVGSLDDKSWFNAEAEQV